MKTANEMTDTELTEAYKNAYTTHGGCGGHSKAYHNMILFTAYKEELYRRELPIPTEEGQFNGFGSY